MGNNASKSPLANAKGNRATTSSSPRGRVRAREHTNEAGLTPAPSSKRPDLKGNSPALQKPEPIKQLETTTCRNCSIQVGPTEQCLLQPCQHSLCLPCMIERQAAAAQGQQLTCDCGAAVVSHIWEKLSFRGSSVVAHHDEEEAVVWVQQIISHQYETTTTPSDTRLEQLVTLPDEVLMIVLSYVPDGQTLAALDATCTRFQTKTPPYWEARARQRFGIFGHDDAATGKERWQAASALLRPPVSVPLAQYHPDGAICGTPKLGMAYPSGRILVMGSDDHMHEPEQVPDVQCDFPLVVRDVASDGNYSPVILDGAISTWKIAVLGSNHDEIVVNGYRDSIFVAQRINRREGGLNQVTFDVRALDFEHDIEVPSYQGEPMVLLGCPKMMILARRGQFYVFVPDEERLLKLIQVTQIESHYGIAAHRGMGWVSPEVGENAFACSTHRGRVCVWRAELQGDSVEFHNVLNIRTNHAEHFEAIAVSSSYVAVSPATTKRIYLYDHNGTWLSALSEGLDETRYMDFGSNTFPISMFATGEILVSSSVTGAALCIWDMRQGVLVHRFMDLFDRSKTPWSFLQDPLAIGNDVTSMVPLYGQGAVCFCVFGGCQYAWGFPGNQARYLELQTLAQSQEQRESQEQRLESESKDSE